MSTFSSPQLDTEDRKRCELTVSRETAVFEEDRGIGADSIVFTTFVQEPVQQAALTDDSLVACVTVTGIVETEVAVDFPIEQAREIHAALGKLLEPEPA